jgi:hypothetical protein
VIALTDRIGAAGDEDLVREVGVEIGEVPLDDLVFGSCGHSLVVAVDVEVDGGQKWGDVGLDAAIEF